MYSAFSGYRATRQALITTIAASRVATRSAEDVELVGLERNARLVAVGRDPGNAEDVVERPPADQRRDADREVTDLRGMADVSEIDDRGDATAVVEQDVVEVQVAVHDVRSKPRPARRDVRSRSDRARSPRDGGDRVLDRLAERAELRRVCRDPRAARDRTPGGRSSAAQGSTAHASRRRRGRQHPRDRVHRCGREAARRAGRSASRPAPPPLCDMPPRPSADDTTRGRATGRSGSTREMCRIASASRSSVAGSSPRFESLMTPAPPAPRRGTSDRARYRDSSRSLEPEELRCDPCDVVIAEARRSWIRGRSSPDESKDCRRDRSREAPG